ncbi:HAD family hydrolase [Aliidiomarina soli]|uniref:HAD-IB family hydrolase n=1 Tax=Aliidiomarina soli TaxID=1928574 RepID=A0A432WJV7_9GAMM|nr:HAD family hydrolase [Aliidiomarina soli]RUO34090.1 HAD-IB family hydrolase [Aliidiomarina soli]
MALALFDFDGTVTTHETMPVFIKLSVGKRRLVFGHLILAPLILGFKLGFVSGVVIRRVIVRLAYSRVPIVRLERSGHQFAEQYLSASLRPEAMERINWHKDSGHKVVIVSGGLDIYLAPWCQKHGLDLICSSLEHREGLLTGKYDGEQCVLSEKVRRVHERYDLDSFESIYAYGDTLEDKDMLNIATNAYYQWQHVESATKR